MFGDNANTSEKFLKIENEATLSVVGDEVRAKAKFCEVRRRYVFDPSGSFRFGVNIWDGAQIRLLEGGWRLYKSLVEAVKANGPMNMYKVTRLGTGRDTAFSTTLERALTAEEMEQIEAATRLDLVSECKWSSPDAEPMGGEEIPF